MSFDPLKLAEEKAQEILKEAKRLFDVADYRRAEDLLNQLVLKGTKDALLFHMLGSIYYDQGKFNKAIKAFQRALEIDPGFTDAGIGLSIIFNDLGRYDEGQKVFEEAKTMLSTKAKTGDPFLHEKLANKHDELGELYRNSERWDEALEQFQTAFELTQQHRSTVAMKIVEIYLIQNRIEHAMTQLKQIIHEDRNFSPARLKLGKLFYDSQQVPEAVEQWEEVLRFDPKNLQAADYLRLAHSIETIHHTDQDLTR